MNLVVSIFPRLANWRRLAVIASNSDWPGALDRLLDWRIVLLACVVIGYGNYFGFGFTTFYESFVKLDTTQLKITDHATAACGLEFKRMHYTKIKNMSATIKLAHSVANDAV